MKFKQLLTKSLLAAVCLLAGASASWGDNITSLPFSKTWTTAGGSTSPFDAGTIKTGTNVTALNVNNTTATALFDTNGEGAPYALATDEEVTISFTAYHGWNTGGANQGVKLINSGGHTIAEYVYNLGSCNITGVNIGEVSATGWSSSYNCQSRYNANSNANGFSGGSKNQAYQTTAGWNPVLTIKIRYDGYVTLNVYYPNHKDGSIDYLYTGNLPNEWDVDIQKIQVYSGTNSDDRTMSINNLNITSEIAERHRVTFTYEDTDGNSLSSFRADSYVDVVEGTSIAELITGSLTSSFYNGDESVRYDYSTYSVAGDITEVPASDITVTLKFAAKERCNYSVNAVDGNDIAIKEGVISGTCDKDETVSYYLPTCVLADGTLHFMAAEASYKSETVSSDKQVFSYPYTTSSVDNVVFFVEGENISGASWSAPSESLKGLASKGYMGRGSNLNVTTLPAGTYTIYVKYINTNSSAHSLLVKAGDTDIINATDVTVRPTKSGSVTLTEPTAITLTAAASSTSGVDYLYIVKTGDTKTISSAGWATFCSPYALDLANATGLTDAYIVTGGSNGVLTKSSVKGGTVPANTGLLLKGNEGTATIPVVANSKTNVENNILKGVTAETQIDAGTGWVLMGSPKLGFYQNTNLFTVGANTAYILVEDLPVPQNQTTGARASYLLFDDMTGISQVAGSEVKTNGVIYNLNGQRVSNPTKGIYIIDGVKVAIE